MNDIWLDLQYGFALFIGPIITFGLGIAVAAALLEELTGLFFNKIHRVDIVRKVDDEMG